MSLEQYPKAEKLYRQLPPKPEARQKTRARATIITAILTMQCTWEASKHFRNTGEGSWSMMMALQLSHHTSTIFDMGKIYSIRKTALCLSSIIRIK